ncbi:MAG: hypothetical protein JW855_02000 [Gammaproteobacteria bacterium]|nr:hypothetical protein [Gammaproteobacteria bacterium]
MSSPVINISVPNQGIVDPMQTLKVSIDVLPMSTQDQFLLYDIYCNIHNDYYQVDKIQLL